MRLLAPIVAIVGLATILAGCTGRGERFLEPEAAFPPADESRTVKTFHSRNPMLANPTMTPSTKTLPAAIDDFVESAIDARASSEFNFGENGSVGTKPERIKTFIERGIALSNQLCILWFEELRAEQKRIDNYQGLFVTTASGLNTLFGILNLGTDVLTGAAAATTAGNALFDNYRAAFLFSPDLVLIKEKIDTLRKQSLTSLRQTNFGSYEEARDALLTHDDICSGKTVENIIKRSVEVSAFKFEISGGPPSPEDLMDVGALIRKIVELVDEPNTKDLTERQIKQLYLAYLGNLDEATVKKLTEGSESLIEAVFKKIESDRKATAQGADNFKMIIAALQRIGTLLNLEADAEDIRVAVRKKEELEKTKDNLLNEDVTISSPVRKKLGLTTGDAVTAAVEEMDKRISNLESATAKSLTTLDLSRRGPGYSFGYRVVPGPN